MNAFQQKYNTKSTTLLFLFFDYEQKYRQLVCVFLVLLLNITVIEFPKIAIEELQIK